MKKSMKTFLFILLITLISLSFDNEVLASTIWEQHSCSALRTNSDITYVGIGKDKRLSAWMNINSRGIKTNNLKEYSDFSNWDLVTVDIIPSENIADYDGTTCPDIILVNKDRHKELYYKSNSSETAEQSVQNFYNEYTNILNGKHSCFLVGNCQDYNDTNVYVTLRAKKLENVTKTIEENYRAIDNAVIEFRKYFDYGADTTTVPKIGCPMRFHEVNDLSKYTVEQLEQQLTDADVMTTQFSNIINSYKKAVNYYNDDSVFPGLALFFSPNDPSNSIVKDLRSLKTYYDSNHSSKEKKEIMTDSDLSSTTTTSNINEDFNFAPYPFRNYLDAWVKAVSMYDLDYWKSTIEIIADSKSNETVSDETVSNFTQICVVDYKNRLNEEISARYARGQLTKEEYEKFQQRMKELDEKIQQLLSTISSLYNTFNDFYGENSIVDCESILTKEFIEWLEWAYKVTEIIAIIFVIIFSFLDFMKAIASSDGDALKKSGNKFIKRLIVLVVLLLLPILINFILKIAGISGIDSDNPICIKVGD